MLVLLSLLCLLDPLRKLFLDLVQVECLHPPIVGFTIDSDTNQKIVDKSKEFYHTLSTDLRIVALIKQSVTVRIEFLFEELVKF